MVTRSALFMFTFKLSLNISLLGQGFGSYLVAPFSAGFGCDYSEF